MEEGTTDDNIKRVFVFTMLSVNNCLATICHSKILQHCATGPSDTSYLDKFGIRHLEVFVLSLVL